jgi:hypothetical protein
MQNKQFSENDFMFLDNRVLLISHGSLPLVIHYLAIGDPNDNTCFFRCRTFRSLVGKAARTRGTIPDQSARDIPYPLTTLLAVASIGKLRESGFYRPRFQWAGPANAMRLVTLPPTREPDYEFSAVRASCGVDVWDGVGCGPV